MSREELDGLFRTFPFYVRFPEEKFDEIKEAGTNDSTYEKLTREFEPYR